MSEIRFEVHGTGGPSLVLVHGWALDRHVWDGQLPGLSARHRVVTLDLPGHGDSARVHARWTMSAFGRHVKGVVDSLDLKSVVLVGHSMGGAVALEAARRMPERLRGVVLVDTLLDVEQRLPLEQIDAVARQLEADYEPVVTQMANEYQFAPATPAAVRERVLRHATRLSVDVSVALLRETWSYDPLPALAEIKAPIHAVSGDKYPTNLEANRRHMPGYQASIVHGTGHYPMLEDPTTFSRALDEALARVQSAS